MQEVVLRFGVFRELLTDGAPKLAGKVIEELVQLLQAHQINPVPYRPQLVGLVERFHRSWKDCVATFMQDERQVDWNLWVKFAVYSYNSARHSTVALSPNELMMGRRLRAPNELLRRTEVTEAGELPAYHANLLKAMERSHESAEQARRREQERQARYYNRKTRNKRQFQVGDLVWMHNPPRGKKATNYHYPEALLAQVARDIDEQLDYEDQRPTRDEPETAAAVRSAKAPAGRTTRAGGSKRMRAAVDDAVVRDVTRGLVVERLTQVDGLQVTAGYGSTMDVHGRDGRQWRSTNGSTETTGSWKTRVLRKSCKEARVSAESEMADVARISAYDVEAGVSVVYESGRPRSQQDLLHGIYGTSGISGLSEPRETSSFEIWTASEQADWIRNVYSGFRRPADKPPGSETCARERARHTNVRTLATLGSHLTWEAPTMPTELRTQPGRPRQHKPRTCWKCAKVFARPANLRRHLQKVNKCDKKSKKAQQEARKIASRLSSRVHYLKKKLERSGGLAVDDAAKAAWEDPAAALASAKELVKVNFADLVDLC
ncbi:hypothetical protein ON010_g9993 [Phytophthora cinnamomi]|nr:hypothetical protein ON010_g9993 [Phytophthora cinnamomi]